MKSWHLFFGLLVLLAGCQTRTLTGIPSPAGPLVASGTIQAEEIHVASELGGRIMAIHAGIGDTVHAGELLVELDTTPLFVQISEAETAVALAKAELALLLAGPHPAEIAAAEANLQFARANRNGAKTAWRNALQQVENPQELSVQIADANTRVSLAVQAVEMAEAQLQHQQLLRDQHEGGSLQRQMADYQVMAAEAALAAANADQVAAQTLLNWLYVIHNEPLGLITQANLAHGEYRMWWAGTLVARAQVEDLLAGPTPEEIVVAETAVALAKAELEVLKVQQQKFTICSYGNGILLEQDAYPGEVVAPAATILTIADLQELTLTVYVPASRLGAIVLGQEVTVTVNSFPNRSFYGEVLRIGSEPEFTPRNVVTAEERLNTFYAIAIHLENSAGILKPGMLADATFP